MRLFLILSAALLLGGPLLAHETKGPDGRQETDAGSMHVGVLAKEKSVEVYLSDAAGKPVDASGYKGVGIFIIGGKPSRIVLAPAGGDRLIGTAPNTIVNPVKGAVQITNPDGATVQGKFK
jgi:hypothetical protein